MSTQLQQTIMTTSQQHLAPQSTAYQLKHSQITEANPEQSVGRSEAVITPPLGQIDTLALVQYGGITAAIILAIAVLILALAEYNKVFVPVMLQKPDDKTKSTFRRNIRSKR